MPEVFRPRGSEGEARALAGAHIDGRGVQAAAAHGAELVGPPLLAGGQLGHGGNHNVAEVGPRAALRRETGENPRAALVVHQPARAVDRVDDALADGFCHRRTPGEGRRPRDIVEPFHDQFDRPRTRPVRLEPGADGAFADAVDLVDRVGGSDGGNPGEAGRAPFTGGPERVTDVILQRAEQATGAFELGDGHAKGIICFPIKTPPGRANEETFRRRSGSRQTASSPQYFLLPCLTPFVPSVAARPGSAALP